MGTGLDDLSVGDDDDQVGHADGGEAVTDKQGDAAGGFRDVLGGSGEPLEKRMLGGCVEARGGLVQHEEQRGLSQHCSAESDLLPLPR